MSRFVLNLREIDRTRESTDTIKLSSRFRFRFPTDFAGNLGEPMVGDDEQVDEEDVPPESVDANGTGALGNGGRDMDIDEVSTFYI